MWDLVCDITNLANKCWNVHGVGGEAHAKSHTRLRSSEFGHKLLQFVVNAQVTYRTEIRK